MRRRDVLKAAGLGGASLALPWLGLAQPAGTKLVGVLILARAGDPITNEWAGAVRDGLSLEGWIDGANVRIEERFSIGGDAQIAADLSLSYASELAALDPDVLVGGATDNTLNLRAAAPETPIAFAAVADPIGAGLVESFAEPGGLITGVAHMPPSVSGQWLELLLQIAPQTTEVGFLLHPEVTTEPLLSRWEALLGPAAQVGVTPTLIEVRSLDEIGAAIDDLATRPNTGLIVPQSRVAPLEPKLHT